MADSLVAELRECMTNPAGEVMPDHAEPFGADCGLLRRAADALEAAQRDVASLKASIAAIHFGIGAGYDSQTLMGECAHAVPELAAIAARGDGNG